MTFSNFTLCFEGVQRVYRNTIVRHLRTVFEKEFGASADDRLKKPFKPEDWNNIETNALAPRLSGALGTPLQDQFDLLSVNHFFNLFDTNFEILCPLRGNTKEQIGSEKRNLLEWLRKVKELRDPTSHPPEADLEYEDAFVLLDCARRVLGRLGYTEQQARVHELMGMLSGRSLSYSDPLESNLPPQDGIVVDFVGRSTELKVLWGWLRDPVAKRWALSGAGGKGKTAIGYQFAL